VDGVGGETKENSVEAVPRREGGIGSPGEKMVECQLKLREQVGPAIGRESGVARRESGDQVVFGSADGPLCRKGAVVLRGGVLERKGDRAKKGSKVRRSFVVDLKVSERVRER
jgi:hypothetical protein